MREKASRLSGIARLAVLATLAFGAPAVAYAGETAEKAADAENLLAAGKVPEAIDAIDASVEAFWKSAPLAFRKALFVDDVKGFGDYVPHDGSAFAPKTSLKVYAEPVGFGWTPVENGDKAVFRAAIEIQNDKGVILARSPSAAVLEKFTRSKSRDFHLTVGFDLPDLKPGTYKLVLTVTDEATGKSAPIILPLTIS